MEMTMRWPCTTTAVALFICLAAGAHARAQRPPGDLRRRPCIPGGPAGPPRHVPHPRAAGGDGAAEGQRHPGHRPGRRAMTKGENGVWEVTLGPVDPRRVPLHLQRRRRSRRSTRATRRPASPTTTSGAWSPCPARTCHGHEERAARRRRLRHLLLHGARAVPPHARLHAAGLRDGQGPYPVFYLLHGAGDSDDSWTLRRPRRLHPGQPDRRRQGQADDRRDAGRPHAARSQASGGRAAAGSQPPRR